jgi:Icc protein
MKITKLDPEPIYVIPYHYSSKGNSLVSGEYPIFHAQVDKLPSGTEAIFVTSDLQGVEMTENGESRLLGHVLVETLCTLSQQQIVPPTSQIGIILGGDLYSGDTADSRGVSGDVTSIWLDFGQHFQWVAGVAGNHDRFGNNASPSFGDDNNLYFLDGRVCNIQTLKLAGISGIIGNPRKLLRRSETEFVQLIEEIIRSNPDIFILHEGPDHPTAPYKGRTSIRLALETASNLLAIFGHCYWPAPLYELNSNVQLLNVDSRGVLLTTIK